MFCDFGENSATHGYSMRKDFRKWKRKIKAVNQQIKLFEPQLLKERILTLDWELV